MTPKLYKANVSDSHFTKHGIGYFVQHGEPDTHRGTPMVKLSHGVIVPAHGWHADFEDAVLEAAERIESLGQRLLSQAYELRLQAKKAEVTT